MLKPSDIGQWALKKPEYTNKQKTQEKESRIYFIIFFSTDPEYLERDFLRREAFEAIFEGPYMDR